VPEFVFVALGSNIGDRAGNLRFARDQLARLPDTELVRASSVEETEPVGPISQDPYLNQMVLLRTHLSPRKLLQSCQEIERQAGRVREVRWGPRTLDLDIVRFGDREVSEPSLVVPHPEIPNRSFWQLELAELEPYARG
jgi:2-amino-4-hydroxy-6-hydroxymethyldihydropteridine diphosphokinase